MLRVSMEFRQRRPLPFSCLAGRSQTSASLSHMEAARVGDETRGYGRAWRILVQNCRWKQARQQACNQSNVTGCNSRSHRARPGFCAVGLLFNRQV